MAPLLLAALPALAQTPLEPKPAAAAPAAVPIPLELNKLEPLTAGSPGCRAYFVVSNPDTTPIEQLRVDLILFGTDGVIARRLAFDLGPLAPKKIAVRLFDVAGLPCDGIGRILVNDVLLCKQETEESHEACLDRLAVTSRTTVPLQK
jgi:hypothetical protein